MEDSENFHGASTGRVEPRKGVGELKTRELRNPNLFSGAAGPTCSASDSARQCRLSGCVLVSPVFFGS